MKPETIGLIIGGVVPAFAFGISNVFMKASTKGGISVAPYLLISALALLTVAIILFVFTKGNSVSFQSGAYAFVATFIWGLAIASATIALSSYGVSLSRIVPIFNMNTLISVFLALWVFAEWKQVKVPQLLIGTLLIMAGGIMVAKS